MHRHTYTTLGAVLLLVVAGVAPAAAAPGDGNFFANLAQSGDQGQEGIMADIGAELAQASGEVARLQASIDVPVWGDDTAETGNATAYAVDATQAFNANNETIAAIANANTDASTEYDVWTVYFHDQEGGNVTRYVVANVSDGKYTNARMLNESEFNATGRSSDHYLSLDWYASRNADAEIEQFAEQFEDDQNISRSYGAKMWAQYGSGVESDLWNATDE